MGKSQKSTAEPLNLTNQKEEINLNGHVAVHKTRKVRDVGGYQLVGIPKGWSERVTDFLNNPVIDISLVYTKQKGYVIIIESPQRK